MYLPYNFLLWQYDKETWLIFEATYTLMVLIYFLLHWIAIVFVTDGWDDLKSFQVIYYIIKVWCSELTSIVP